MRMGRLALGRVRIFAFSAGTFELDRAAMFGGSSGAAGKKTPCRSEVERYRLALNCYLIETPSALILADTGVGPLLNRKYLEAYRFRDLVDIPAALAEFGFAEADVDIVFNSHLHFDHCGGNVRRGPRGEIVPAFPKARFVIHKGEWESAFHPVAADRASYVQSALEPLGVSGRLGLIDGRAMIAEGVEVFVVPGHTEFHCGLKVSATGPPFVVTGDLVPTSAHVGLRTAMSFDLFPARNMETKEAFFREAVAGDWVVGLSHDPDEFFGKIAAAGPGFRFEPLG